MIGFYGGSFNPVHLGHIEVARFLCKSPFIEKICFTPVYRHAFGKKLASFEDRVNMLNLAVKGEECLCVSSAEKEKGGVSYTVDLLAFLKKKYGDDFFFLAGADSLNSIESWKDWQTILSLYNIVFTTRGGLEIREEIIPLVERVSGKRVKFVDNVRLLNPKGINVVKVPDIPVSSTEARKMIAEGKDLSGILHPDVISYIYRKKLYKEKTNG